MRYTRYCVLRGTTCDGCCAQSSVWAWRPYFLSSRRCSGSSLSRSRQHRLAGTVCKASLTSRRSTASPRRRRLRLRLWPHWPHEVELMRKLNFSGPTRYGHVHFGMMCFPFELIPKSQQQRKTQRSERHYKARGTVNVIERIPRIFQRFPIYTSITRTRPYFDYRVCDNLTRKLRRLTRCDQTGYYQYRATVNIGQCILRDSTRPDSACHHFQHDGKRHISSRLGYRWGTEH